MTYELTPSDAQDLIEYWKAAAEAAQRALIIAEAEIRRANQVALMLGSTAAQGEI